MHLPNGTILNNKCYRIKKFIGQGGFGITYLAEEIGYYRNTGFGDAQYVLAKDPHLVVIKELFRENICQRNSHTGVIHVSHPSQQIDFTKLVRNHLNEGKKLRNLNHPHVVKTRDIFEENDTAYMVMEFIEGQDLSNLIKKSGGIEKSRCIKYILQVLSALVHVHDHKILHLDVKPPNILIRKDTDSAVLIDFGIAQAYHANGKIVDKTSDFIPAISPNYAPIEQEDRSNIKSFDPTFDTYAVGATLYHALTGKMPPGNKLLSSGREILVLPTEVLGSNNISDYLDAIISKALSREYRQRFSSAAQFADLLTKENEYQNNLREINMLLAAKSYEQAFKKIIQTERDFLPTATLARLKGTTQPQVQIPSQEYQQRQSHSNEETQILLKTKPQQKTAEQKPVKQPSGIASNKRVLQIAAIILAMILTGVGFAVSNRYEDDYSDLSADTSLFYEDTISMVGSFTYSNVQDSNLNNHGNNYIASLDTIEPNISSRDNSEEELKKYFDKHLGWGNAFEVNYGAFLLGSNDNICYVGILFRRQNNRFKFQLVSDDREGQSIALYNLNLQQFGGYKGVFVIEEKVSDIKIPGIERFNFHKKSQIEFRFNDYSSKKDSELSELFIKLNGKEFGLSNGLD